MIDSPAEIRCDPFSEGGREGGRILHPRTCSIARSDPLRDPLRDDPLRGPHVRSGDLTPISGTTAGSSELVSAMIPAMCGIAGIVSLDGSSVDRGLLERMGSSLRHR